MKKFLPKTIKNPQGFTLIELLVVVAIIAILSVIGIAVFGNIQYRARDARREADIDAISKAYEVTYDSTQTSPYKVLVGTDFQIGTVPTPPESPKGSYTGVLTQSANTYTVCATLEGGVAGCTSTSATCYCKTAAQAVSAGSTGSVTLCQTTISPAAPSNCKATGLPTGYSTATTLYFCPPTTNLTCANGTTGTGATNNTAYGTYNYYNAASGGSVAGTVTIYPSNTSVTGAALMSAGVRTTNP